MFHFTHFHHYKFLLKKEMNLFYYAIFLMTLASALIDIFIPIYLFEKGYQIYEIIFFYFLVAFWHLVFMLFGAKIVSKIGAKHSILISIPFQILYYLLISFYVESTFYFLPFLLAFYAIFFNMGYHLNYIEHSDSKHRGKEISILQILGVLASMLSPFVAGFLIYYLGYSFIFVFSSILLFLGVLPLILTKDIHETLNFSFVNFKKYFFEKRYISRSLSYSAYAVESSVERIVWPLFLLLILTSTQLVGTMISFTMLISVAIFYFVGKLTDKYDKGKILKYGSFFYFFGWSARVFANTSFVIFLVDSYKNISQKFVYLPWGAKSYDIAQKEDYFLFIVIREIIFTLSRILIFPVLILVFYMDFYPFLVSFVVAAIVSLFYPLLRD